VLLQSLHTPTVLSLLSFHEHSDPLGDFVFLLLPQMENQRLLADYPTLQQPLAECFWVFSNPVRIPQWILPLTFRTHRVLFSCVVCTPSRCPPGGVSSPTERSTVLGSCALMHSLNALLAELLRISSDSGLSLNPQQSSFLCAPLYTCSMPTWQSFSESSVILVCDCVFSHSLAS
jgi:hypothetical protein